MTFDFVIETPSRRGINRNNNKIIQRRATQAGARTRLGNKSVKNNAPNSGNPPVRLQHARPQGTDQGILLANARLAATYNSPFLVRFGGQGQVLYVKDPNAASSNTCFRLPDPTLSVLQTRLLLTLATRPIASDANRLFKIMSLTARPFLQHLPSHYGQLPFLDEAIECLIARLHDTVPVLRSDTDSESGHRVSPTALYGKALTSLRSAIDSDITHNLSYIWFAIMLLTLFEVKRHAFKTGAVLTSFSYSPLATNRVGYGMRQAQLECFTRSDQKTSRPSSTCRCLLRNAESWYGVSGQNQSWHFVTVD